MLYNSPYSLIGLGPWSNIIWVAWIQKRPNYLIISLGTMQMEIKTMKNFWEFGSILAKFTVNFINLPLHG